MSSKRTLLIVLVIFVVITTMAMVLISQDFTINMRQLNNDVINSSSTLLSSLLFSSLDNSNALAINRSNSFISSGTTEQSKHSSSDKGNVSASIKVLQIDVAANQSNSSSHQAPTGGTAKTETPPDTAEPQAAAPTNRPMTCADCFLSNLTILVENPHVCDVINGTGPVIPELIVIITSAPDDLSRRQAIRDTWISITKNNTAHIRHIFLLGTLSGDVKISANVTAESQKYHDVIVADFVDSYGNLTWKTMVGLRWIVEHCNVAKFFLKTDHDMYVFVERILNLAKENEMTLMTSLGGQCYQSASPWRDPKTKYYASVRSYPQATYPGFCSGTGYISTLNLARKAVETSPNIPFFHLEDVYLTLVLRHVGLTLTNYPGFVMGENACGTQSSKAIVKTIHEVGPPKIVQLWTKCGV